MVQSKPKRGFMGFTCCLGAPDLALSPPAGAYPERASSFARNSCPLDGSTGAHAHVHQFFVPDPLKCSSPAAEGTPLHARSGTPEHTESKTGHLDPSHSSRSGSKPGAPPTIRSGAPEDRSGSHASSSRLKASTRPVLATRAYQQLPMDAVTVDDSDDEYVATAPEASAEPDALPENPPSTITGTPPATSRPLDEIESNTGPLPGAGGGIPAMGSARHSNGSRGKMPRRGGGRSTRIGAVGDGGGKSGTLITPRNVPTPTKHKHTAPLGTQATAAVSSTHGSVTSEPWRTWTDHPFNNDYNIVGALGRGAFADVVLGRHKRSKKCHALKIVYLNKPGLKEKHVHVLQREGVYLAALNHPNIVRCLKIYQAPKRWVLVLEHLRGGMLLTDLAKLKYYSERMAASVFRQVLSAVAYLHEKQLVHRDIKPENVVFQNPVSSKHDYVVKLVDFGMILDTHKEPHCKGMMGSPGFVAPEVILGQNHTPAMDCYSMGVLLFVMLVGSKPMSQDQAKTMQYALMTAETLKGMGDPRWHTLSADAKDLVLKLLQPDPTHRLTAKQALAHRWISGAREDSVLDGSVMEGWADQMKLLQAAYMGSPSPYGAHGLSGPSTPVGLHHALLSPHTGYRNAAIANLSLSGAGQSDRLFPSTPPGVSATLSHGAGVPRPPHNTAPLSGNHAVTASQLNNNGRSPSARDRESGAGSPHPITWGLSTADAASTVGGGATGGAGRDAGGASGFMSPSGGGLSVGAFVDPASRAVHDEVLKAAQEKLVEAQQFFHMAHAIRQCSHTDNGSTLSQTGVGSVRSHATTPEAAHRASGGGDNSDDASASKTSHHDTPNMSTSISTMLLSTQHTNATQAPNHESQQHLSTVRSGCDVGGTPSSSPGGMTHNWFTHSSPVEATPAAPEADFDAALNDARNLMMELNEDREKDRSAAATGASAAAAPPLPAQDHERHMGGSPSARLESKSRGQTPLMGRKSRSVSLHHVVPEHDALGPLEHDADLPEVADLVKRVRKARSSSAGRGGAAAAGVSGDVGNSSQTVASGAQSLGATEQRPERRSASGVAGGGAAAARTTGTLSLPGGGNATLSTPPLPGHRQSRSKSSTRLAWPLDQPIKDDARDAYYRGTRSTQRRSARSRTAERTRTYEANTERPSRQYVDDVSHPLDKDGIYERPLEAHRVNEASLSSRSSKTPRR